MTHNPFTRSGALQALAQELDPAPPRIDLARRRYNDLGDWLKQHAGEAAYDVVAYTQGSAALGTTNQNPFTTEFDVDLVVSVRLRKDQITQDALNQVVNGWLGSYTAARQSAGGDLAPSRLHRGKRAWTLEYSDHFHMDVLPVVPDLGRELRADGGDPSWLTDKELTRWQPTNPKGFAGWFLELSRLERQVLAKEAKMDIEELPVFGGPKTQLQQAVRLFKRHRDHAFEVDPDNVAPPSVVISALASYAYEEHQPTGDLGSVLDVLAKGMPEFVAGQLEDLLIPNPTCPDENYADRYGGNTKKRAALGEWLDRLQQDTSLLYLTSEADDLTKAVDTAFGSGLGERVAKRLGEDAQSIRTKGALGSSAAGTLSTGGTSRRHKDHTFYGDKAE